MTNDIMTQWGRQAVDPANLERIAAQDKPKRRLATKLGILAVACAACFAPALALAASNGGLNGVMPHANKAAVAVPEAPVAPSVQTVLEVVVVAKGPRKAVPSPRRAVRTCSDLVTEIYGTAVRVCDVSRTGNGKAGLWVPVAKPTRLAARDLPSPSGLLR